MYTNAQQFFETIYGFMGVDANVGVWLLPTLLAIIMFAILFAVNVISEARNPNKQRSTLSELGYVAFLVCAFAVLSATVLLTLAWMHAAMWRITTELESTHGVGWALASGFGAFIAVIVVGVGLLLLTERFGRRLGRRLRRS